MKTIHGVYSERAHKAHVRAKRMEQFRALALKAEPTLGVASESVLIGLGVAAAILSLFF